MREYDGMGSDGTKGMIARCAYKEEKGKYEGCRAVAVLGILEVVGMIRSRQCMSHLSAHKHARAHTHTHADTYIYKQGYIPHIVNSRLKDNQTCHYRQRISNHKLCIRDSVGGDGAHERLLGILVMVLVDPVVFRPMHPSMS